MQDGDLCVRISFVHFVDFGLRVLQGILVFHLGVVVCWFVLLAFSAIGFQWIRDIQLVDQFSCPESIGSLAGWSRSQNWFSALVSPCMSLLFEASFESVCWAFG